MYFDVFIMIGLVAGCFPAYITGKRPRTTMHFHMFGQIITPMERFTAFRHFAHILLHHFVFPDVTLTVVLPYELTAAVVARVGAHRLVGIHVGYIFCVSYECTFAQGALVGLR